MPTWHSLENIVVGSARTKISFASFIFLVCNKNRKDDSNGNDDNINNNNDDTINHDYLVRHSVADGKHSQHQ